MISNICPDLIIKYVSSSDFYEIKNTATDKFAFCDGALIVAMITLQETYFLYMFFSYNN